MSYDSSGHSKGGRIVTSSQVGMVNAASQGSVGAGGSVIEPVDADLESARNVFGERVKELSAAVARVDALTRQLEELRKGNTINSYHVTSNNDGNNSNTIKFNQEFEKLRQELLYRSRLVQNQSVDLESKKSLLNQKKNELVVIDEKIAQLQQRLAKKRHINQQLSYQMQSTQAALSVPGIGLNYQFNTLRGTSSHSYKRLPINQQRSTVPNIAAVEPIQRQQQPQSAVDATEVNLKGDVTLCMYSKHDPKYQTLPPNTKFYRNGLELTPNTNVPGRTGVSRGGSLRVKDGVRCALDEGMVIGGGGELKDVSSQLPSSSTPAVDGAPEDGTGSLRIVTSSESGVGSSISSGCSFQSNSIYLMNGCKTLHEDVAGNREGELRARGINLPITISSNSSGATINTTTQPTLQPLNNGSNLGAVSVEEKGLSDHSLRVPSSSSTSSAPTSSFSTIQQNSIISTLSSDHTITKNNNDWQKSRRRPVVVDDEDMERQLSAPDSDVIELTQKHFPIETRKSSITTHSPKENIQSHHQPIVKSVTGNSSPIKISHDCGEESDSLSSVTCDVTDDSLASFSWNQVVPHLEKVVVVEKTIESLNAPMKQQKDGGHDQSKALLANEVECVSKRKSGLLKNNQKGLTRRVSFDPLALLLDAALEGELELVKKTASQVPDPSAVKDEGITALHNAICAGHFPIVRFLVEIACDVNAQDSDGWTPLHCAASCNNLAMVQLLVQNGACIFATTFSDHETAAEKCEEDEVGFDECCRYLSGVQEEMGIKNERVVYAVYDYDAQNSDEMSFKDGDRVSILRRGDDQEVDWWWARSENGTEGYVPRNLFGLYPRVKPKQRSEHQEK